MAEAVKEKIGRKGRKKAGGKACRVDSSGQLGLFEASEGTESGKDSGEGRRRRWSQLPEFIDPDPAGIWLGQERLGDFLKRTGEREAFLIREFLGEMDWLKFEAKSKRGGRRPYSPKGMVGLILLGILEGRTSLRQLEKLARSDLRAMWITGGICPDHTVIGRFIHVHGDQISEEFFVELSAQVVTRTASRSGQGALDGTVVQAAASGYRLIRAEAAAEMARQSRKRAEEKPQQEELRRQAEQAEAVQRAAQQRVAARRAQRKKHPERVLVSVTDAEAVNQPLKSGVPAPAYRPSIIANGDRIILGQSVDPSSEQRAVGELLRQSQAVNQGPLGELMADSNYFTSTVIEAVRESKVGSFLVPEGQSLGEGPWEKKRLGKFAKTQFTYDAEQDCYHCPAGHRLVRMGQGKDRGKPYRQYGKAPCKQCSLRGQCTEARQGRMLRRYHDDEIKDTLRAKMRQPEARAVYKKRQGMVEPVFSALKGQQLLTRFRRHGLQKVRVEFALHAAAYNLGRFLRIGLRAPLGRHPVLAQILALLTRFFRGSNQPPNSWIPEKLVLKCEASLQPVWSL